MCNYLSELPNNLLVKPVLLTDGVMHKEASTITDIHNTSDNTEVHLISLVSEQIPKYRLRSESPAGYYQQDWLQTPLLSPSSDTELSPELYEQTFQYFMISGNRLSQMTQTYHDIEAVTNLLEEKERDLELAARIGQTLLQKNRDAELYSQKLEEELENVMEQVSQLKHEISLKEDLLHTYANDESDSSGAPSPIKEFRKLGSSGMMGHFEELQTRIKRLEVDNGQLRLDKVQFEHESEELETHEHELMSDALKELDDLRRELKNARDCNSLVSEELTQKTDETAKLQEEITRLLTQIVDMQRKQKQVALENEELQQHLFAANSAQLELTKEIQMLEDQYDELSNALNETREQARMLRDSQSNEMVQPIPFSDSLAAELEFDSKIVIPAPEHMESFIVISDGLSEGKAATLSVSVNTSDQEVTSKSPSQRAFDTVRFVNSFRASAKPFLTPSRQNRPIPTPFPLLSQGGGISAPTTTFNSTGADSGRLTSTPNLHIGKYPFLESKLSGKSQKHDVMTPKFAQSVISPYVKLSSRVHAFPPLRQSTISVAQSHSEVGNRPIEMANHLSRKICDTRHPWNRVSRTTPNLGRPGIPGTEDLERAIRKLALRRESLRYIQLQRYHGLSSDADSTGNSSARSDTLSSHSYSTNHHTSPSSHEVSSEKCESETARSPKLRIVKPLEGSVTLNQWKYLAGKDRTLQLSKETRCGVITRDKIINAHSKVVKSTCKTTAQQTNCTSTNFIQRKAQANSTATSSCILDKILENTRRVNKIIKPDNVIVTCENSSSVSVSPGKNFAFTPTKYTYAYSNVKNPDDEYETMPSNFIRVPKMSPKHSSPQSMDGSVQNQSFTNFALRKSSIVPKDNTRTCSMDMGLAQLLKEHGAKAVEEEVNSTADKYKEGNWMSHAKASERKVKPDTLSKSAIRMEFPGPLVWNRTLKRSFLLSANSVGQSFTSKIDRASVSAKPETPPNSPTHGFEEKFTFLDDGYLQPEPNQEIQSGAVGHSQDMLNGPATSSYLEEEYEEPADTSVSATAIQQSGEDDLQNPDWSQLHGSSGALCEPFSYYESKPSSEQR